MGLFDYIGGKVNQMAEDVQKAQLEARHWDPEMIIRKIQVTSSMFKSQGYAQELKIRCEEMDNSQLKDTFDYAYDTRNVKACNVMLSIMEDRDLAYKDDNGRIVRRYR